MLLRCADDTILYDQIPNDSFLFFAFWLILLVACQAHLKILQ